MDKIKATAETDEDLDIWAILRNDGPFASVLFNTVVSIMIDATDQVAEPETSSIRSSIQLGNRGAEAAVRDQTWELMDFAKSDLSCISAEEAVRSCSRLEA
jgi:hypothetical protein